MRYFGSILAILLAMSAVGRAQITKTATFENYAPGTFFQPSFVDPLSGITFLDSTNPLGGFAIDGDPNDLVTGSNYLTAAGGPNDGFGSYFGFTAILPAPSNYVAIDAIYYDIADGPGLSLDGFDSTGVLVGRQSIAQPGKYHLQINSGQYNIETIKVVATGGGEGYDNISYTYLPEPGVISSGVTALVLLSLRRTRKARN